jgi:hypothetical protein
MARRRIVVLGESHVDGVQQAFAARSSTADQPAFSIYRLMSIKNGITVGDLTLEDCIQRCATLDPEDVVVSLLGGNQHAVVGLIQHPIPFDILEPETTLDQLPPEIHCVPTRVMEDYFDKGLRGRDGTKLQALSARVHSRLYHVSPPPPKEDTAHILRRPESAFAQRKIHERGVSPAGLRLRLWELQNRIMRRLCAEWGIGFVPVPDTTLTPNGFLKPEYYARDATHANLHYGELVLKQLEQLAAEVRVADHG